MVLHATGSQPVECLAKGCYCCKYFRRVQEKTRHLHGREIYWGEKGSEKIKKSVESLAYAYPSSICKWLALAEDTGASDVCSEPVLLCPLASLPFCPVFLLGDTVYPGCLLLNGSNVLFLYTLMNKNWNDFKSSSSPLWGRQHRPRRHFTSYLECLANHFVQSWW